MIIALVFMISICHPQSLKGKIMCGYQAWFTTEQDGSNNGWTHYKMNSNKPFAKNNCVFDFWPYIEDY